MKNKYVKRIVKTIIALGILYAIIFPGLNHENEIIRIWFLILYMIIWIWVLELLE
jgi:hypothetical protein